MTRIVRLESSLSGSLNVISLVKGKHSKFHRAVSMRHHFQNLLAGLSREMNVSNAIVQVNSASLPSREGKSSRPYRAWVRRVASNTMRSLIANDVQ